jgi:hypothetical protein
MGGAELDRETTEPVAGLARLGGHLGTRDEIRPNVVAGRMQVRYTLHVAAARSLPPSPIARGSRRLEGRARRCDGRIGLTGLDSRAVVGAGASRLPLTMRLGTVLSRREGPRSSHVRMPRRTRERPTNRRSAGDALATHTRDLGESAFPGTRSGLS